MATNFTDDDLKRLDKAIAQGVMSVRFADGREIRFSTFEEMVGRRNFIAKELGLEAGRRVILSRFEKGVQ